MGRRIRDYTPANETMGDAVVSPHRYTWEDKRPLAETLREARANAPYKPGDIVWCMIDGVARKAKIRHVFAEMGYYGWPREFYTAQLDTKKGLWAKQWRRIYPGFIQRGYHAAGLAPDLDGK